MGCIVFGPRREEVIGQWRKPHELNDLYSSPNIVRVIKMRGIIWAGHVDRMLERRGIYRVLLGKPEVKRHLEDLGVDGRIILRLTFRKWDVGHGLDLAGPG